MSPTTIFTQASARAGSAESVMSGSRVGGVYPGYGDWVGTREGYTGVLPAYGSQGPKYSIFKALGPTHGQMKAIP